MIGTPSNEVLLEKLNHSHEIMLRVEEKVNETNGNVKKNAKCIRRLEGWRSFYGGAIAILAAVVLPIAFMVLNKYI